MRCLLEISYVAQRVQIPPGQGGEPARAGSEPGDGLGNEIGEA